MLESRLGLTKEQRNHRITQMSEAFPEAAMPVPSCLSDRLDGVPDPNDKHVLAAAITGHAHVIVTSNIKDFPDNYLAQFDILCQSPDDFLIHQFHLNPYQILEKLNAQAANIRRQRGEILTTLKLVAPNFAALVETFL